MLKKYQFVDWRTTVGSQVIVIAFSVKQKGLFSSKVSNFFRFNFYQNKNNLFIKCEKILICRTFIEVILKFLCFHLVDTSLGGLQQAK